jgi:hypothetical protein
MCDGGFCSGLMPKGAVSLVVNGLDAGMRTSAWKGACAASGFTTWCDLCPAAATVNSRLRIWPDDNLVFTTDTNRALGAIGSVDAGDSICEAAARSYGLPGIYRAWLGPPLEAAARLAPARGWRRLDGAPFADRAEDLADGGALWATPIVGTNTNGLLVVSTGAVATGALADGGRADCAGWQLSSSDEAGAGNPTMAGRGWQATASNLLRCDQPALLYCFGVDRSRPVAPAPPPIGAPIVFLSSPFSLDAGGVTAANAFCQFEAADAGLSGSFTALLASSLRSLREGLDGGWYRLDGVPFRLAGGDSATLEDFVVAPPNLTLRSGYVTGDSMVSTHTAVFTGVPNSAMGLDEIPTSSTCDNWTRGTGNAIVGNASSTTSWYRAGTSGCSEPARLYCIQR